jgi:hypothetical protein
MVLSQYPPSQIQVIRNKDLAAKEEESILLRPFRSSECPPRGPPECLRRLRHRVLIYASFDSRTDISEDPRFLTRCLDAFQRLYSEELGSEEGEVLVVL